MIVQKILKGQKGQGAELKGTTHQQIKSIIESSNYLINI